MEKTPNRIAEEAAEHFARRVPNAPPPDRRDDLDAWLRSDPRHAREYADTLEVWDQLGGLRDRPELHALRAADLSALRRERWVGRAPMLGLAATLVLVFGAGYLALRHIAAPVPVTYATALGERRTETLQDGSRVVLNIDSALQARYTRGEREIELVRGEAQFDVVGDAARPFVVRAGAVSVTALGTSFQVRQDAADTLVTLLEGSVEVAMEQQRFRMQPGQQARLSRDGVVSVVGVDPEVATGWLEGWLYFRGTPLEEVIAEANRYAGRKLRLGSPELARVGLNGNFRAGQNAAIANAASLILPIRVDDSGEDIVLMPRH